MKSLESLGKDKIGKVYPRIHTIGLSRIFTYKFMARLIHQL